MLHKSKTNSPARTIFERDGFGLIMYTTQAGEHAKITNKTILEVSILMTGTTVIGADFERF